DPLRRNAINKRIACLADADPVKKKNGRWRKCYPFELLSGSNDHKLISSGVDDLKARVSNNISIFCNDNGSGKTLEFDLAFANPECTLLLTPCLSGEYRGLLSELMSTYSQCSFEQYKSLTHIDPDLLRLVDESAWNEDDKKRGLIASYYHQATSGVKGEHALEVGHKLRENCMATPVAPFSVPKNIKDAIAWLCE
ncbi:MAG: hypothetical protein MUO97_10440, partial [Dehalococcoidia bacterium]|nr:hypothetical protein [Dehalococcoidia bacterium]